MKTRKFIEDRIGKLEWGSWEEFKLIREKLIVEDASYEFELETQKKIILMKIQERVSDEETAMSYQKVLFNYFSGKKQSRVFPCFR